MGFLLNDSLYAGQVHFYLLSFSNNDNIGMVSLWYKSLYISREHFYLIKVWSQWHVLSSIWFLCLERFINRTNFTCLYVLNVNHEIIIKCCALCKIARNMYDEIYNSV